MPPEPRKTNTSPSSQGRKERAIGASCAECKRLKIRCNKQVPCNSCLRRGCGSICPDGVIQTGDGHRHFWASTGEIRGKLSKLADRVQQLENALEHYETQHPLLSTHLRQLKDPFLDETSKMPTPDSTPPPESGPTFDAASTSAAHLAGSLQASASPLCLLAKEGVQLTEEEYLQYKSALPPLHRAMALRQSYYDNVSWRYDPVDPEELDNDVFRPLYDISGSAGTSSPTTLPLRTYRLATMFMVLCLGEHLMSESLRSTSSKPNYYDLALALLLRSPLLENPSIEALQVLNLMSVYWFFCKPSPRCVNLLWVLNGITVKLAEAVGLHHDPARLNLAPKEASRRRRVMAEVCSYDSVMAVCLSRPPTLFAANCHLGSRQPDPSREDDVFFCWRTDFLVDCVSKVAMVAYQVTGVEDTSTIMQLDQLIREHPMPAILDMDGYPDDNNEFFKHPRALLQRLTAHILKQRVLLLLHYSHSNYAINDPSQCPLNGPFAGSVLAEYMSALEVISLIQRLYVVSPTVVTKVWFVWRCILGAASMIGNVLARCPEITGADEGVALLKSSVTMFSSVQYLYGTQPLTMLYRLQYQAQLGVDLARANAAPMIDSIPHNITYAPPMGMPCESEDLSYHSFYLAADHIHTAAPTERSWTPDGLEPETFPQTVDLDWNVPEFLNMNTLVY